MFRNAPTEPKPRRNRLPALVRFHAGERQSVHSQHLHRGGVRDLLVSANTMAMSIRERTREWPCEDSGIHAGTTSLVLVGEAVTLAGRGGIFGVLLAAGVSVAHALPIAIRRFPAR